MSKTARRQIDRRAGFFRSGWRASSPGRDDNTFRNRPTHPLDRGLLAGQAAVEAQGRVQADLIDDLREVLDEHKG